MIAFVVADLSHEALGHGVVAHLEHAKLIVLSYTYLTSDVQSRLLSSAGPLVNCVEGLLAFALLRRARTLANVSFFLFLLMVYNVLDAAAYLIYSGVLNSGDLAVVIAGLPHLGLIRTLMVLVGGACYATLTLAAAHLLRRFAPERASLTTPAYLTPIALNCMAALLNPLGLKYFLLSALPATAGSNAGLLTLPALSRRTFAGALHQQSLPRSWSWIIAGLLAAALFIFVIGPGVTLRS